MKKQIKTDYRTQEITSDTTLEGSVSKKKTDGIAKKILETIEHGCKKTTGPELLVTPTKQIEQIAKMCEESCSRGLIDIGKILRTTNDINCMDDSGRTVLILTVYYKKLEIIQELLRTTGINVNLADNKGRTALEIALEDKNSDIINALLGLNPINKEETEVQSSFIQAIISGKIEDLKIALNRGAILSVEFLDLAIRMHKKEIARILMIELDKNKIPYEERLLFKYVKNPTPTSTNLLIDIGCNTNIQNPITGENALHGLEIAGFLNGTGDNLLRNGLDINTVNASGKTCFQSLSEKIILAALSLERFHEEIKTNNEKAFNLVIAFLGGGVEITGPRERITLGRNLLIDRIGKWNFRDNTGRTLRQYILEEIKKIQIEAASDYKDLSLFQEGLLRQDNQLYNNTKDFKVVVRIKRSLEEQEVLDQKLGDSIKSRDITHVEEFLKKGASAYVRNSEDENNLYAFHAIKSGDIEIIRLLLEHGLNPNVTDYMGDSLIHFIQGRDDITELLLDYGAYVDQRTRYGEFTPLMLASCRGYLSTVKLLVSRGATGIMDELGKTPLKVAEENGHYNIVEFLKNNNIK